MNNNKCRVEFEDFLRKELENEEESMASIPEPLSSLPRAILALGEVNER